MKPEAVIVVIKDNQGRFLMGQRSLQKKISPGYWVPISGKVESNESEMEAVMRECFEEIGVKVQPIKKIRVMNSTNDEFVLYWWKAKIISGSPHITSDELTELRWVSKDELLTLYPTFKEHIELLLQL